MYNIHSASAQGVKAKETLTKLYHYYLKHTADLPSEHQALDEGVERTLVDYIAGMTDQFAFRAAEELGLDQK